jgi:two-component system NtrC family sensor kinase
MKARGKGRSINAERWGVEFALKPEPDYPRQRHGEQPEESEPMYWSPLENMPVAVAVIQQRRFRYANPRLERLLGYSKEELYRMDSVLDVVAESSRDLVAINYQEQLTGTSVPPYEFMAVCKGGAEVVLELAGSLIDYEGGPAVQATLWDVTEQHWLRGQLFQLEKMATVGQLVSGVAHEMNNSLAGILGFSELVLRNHELNDELRRDLETIVGEARRMGKITHNLLVFARTQPTEKSLVNVNELLDLTIRLKAYDLQLNEIEVVRRFDPALPLILADADQLVQVFLNIVINAEQSMLPAHSCGTLRLTTEVSRCRTTGAECVVVRINDDGLGIAQERLQRIFDPFYTTKDVGQGTGLGLAICDSIIRSHGGRIYAESDRGNGATFVIELPIRTSDPSPQAL